MTTDTPNMPSENSESASANRGIHGSVWRRAVRWSCRALILMCGPVLIWLAVSAGSKAWPLPQIDPQIAGLVVAVWLSILLWRLPRWQIDGVRRRGHAPRDSLASLEDNFRKTFAQVLAGIGVAGSLYFTYRANESAKERQITEQYSRSVEQIATGPQGSGASYRSNIEVRLGGIYSLGWVAWDSARYHWTVMQVLAEYVRGHAKRCSSTSDDRSGADVMAAIQAIAFRNTVNDPPDRSRLYFSGLNLAGLDISHGNLDGMTLSHACLQGSNLSAASLIGADLTEARLDGANLAEARLDGADLAKARLDGADFTAASLVGADLTKAGLIRADLRDVDLRCAMLNETDLESANLDGASLNRAVFYKTKLRDVMYSSGNVDEIETAPDQETFMRQLTEQLSGACMYVHYENARVPIPPPKYKLPGECPQPSSDTGDVDVDGYDPKLCAGLLVDPE